MSEVGKDLWRVVENTGGEVVKFFGEGRAVWKVPAIGSHDLFLFPKNFTSERSTALLPSLIRWWEWLRVVKVKRRDERHCVCWDATDGRNGCAERHAWETLLEMDPI